MAERVSPEQREAEPYRWCVHCDADCQGVDEIRHATWCPQITGVYPVVVEDRCRYCHQAFAEPRIDPYACCECDAPFERGDSYMHMPTDQDDVFLVVCIGCASRVGAS
jgi:hypothetical protein